MKNTPCGAIVIPVTLFTRTPVGLKKSMRITCVPAEVLPTAISVVHPPPVTTCGNTRAPGPPIVGIVVVPVAGRRAIPIVTAVPVNAGVGIPVIVTGGLTIIGGRGTGMPRTNPGNVTLGDGGATGWARG